MYVQRKPNTERSTRYGLLLPSVDSLLMAIHYRRCAQGTFFFISTHVLIIEANKRRYVKRETTVNLIQILCFIL